MLLYTKRMSALYKNFPKLKIRLGKFLYKETQTFFRAAAVKH